MRAGIWIILTAAGLTVVLMLARSAYLDRVLLDHPVENSDVILPEVSYKTARIGYLTTRVPSVMDFTPDPSLTEGMSKAWSNLRAIKNDQLTINGIYGEFNLPPGLKASTEVFMSTLIGSLCSNDTRNKMPNYHSWKKGERFFMETDYELSFQKRRVLACCERIEQCLAVLVVFAGPHAWAIQDTMIHTVNLSPTYLQSVNK